MMIVVQVNWDENPWFEQSGLVQERLDDLKYMTTEDYAHKWGGAYSDFVENAIIPVDWFNAAIDAHVKLGFKPLGAKIVAHDPSDEGEDAKGLCLRHGSIILDVQEKTDGDSNDGIDWATEYAIDNNADLFVWDGDGLGASLRRDVSRALAGTKTEFQIYKGSEGVDDPDEIYQPDKTITRTDARTNNQTFKNKRAQYHWKLRDRFKNTYLAVVKDEYIDPDTMISISSDIACMAQLRSETCRIPRKKNDNGLIQIMSKQEMKTKHNIPSYNLTDSMIMSLVSPEITGNGAIDDFLSEF